MKGLVLNKENVRLQVAAKTWEEAIRYGAGMLVEQGTATQEYVDGIINAINKLGPYIVVADGLAIPHTRPEEGAKAIGCSLITLKDPVIFEGNDPVSVMICFSAVDSESHMDILKMIVEIVDQGVIEKIAKMTDVDKLLKFLEEI